MSNNVLPIRRHLPPVPPDLIPQDRVVALRSTCAALVRTRRRLIRRLREQLGELRAQAELLTERHIVQEEDGTIAARLWQGNLQEQYGLTPREIEVAALLAGGRGNTAIASALGISPHTARHHTQHVLAKLGVHSRSEAGALLRR